MSQDTPRCDNFLVPPDQRRQRHREIASGKSRRLDFLFRDELKHRLGIVGLRHFISLTTLEPISSLDSPQYGDPRRPLLYATWLLFTDPGGHFLPARPHASWFASVKTAVPHDAQEPRSRVYETS